MIKSNIFPSDNKTEFNMVFKLIGSIPDPDSYII